MMLRVNGDYLDFNDDIEVESQIKLFDEIDTVNGDFSYSFVISKTSNNLKILGFPFPDAIKTIYSNVPCDIIDDSGFIVYSGSLKIESIDREINATFFSGNNEWFRLLGDPMSSLNLSEFDIELNETNIQASWSDTSGIVFPIFDIGGLETRKTPNLKVEDFIGCFYVKTLFEKIFWSAGIKIEGDLLKDPVYNNLIVASNTRNAGEVESRSSYVKKTSNQVFTVPTVVTFQDDVNNPFFDGSKNNYNTTTSRYVADIKMTVNVDLTMKGTSSSGGILSIRKNGSAIGVSGFGVTINSFSKKNITLNAGDYIDISITPVPAGSTITVQTGSSIRVTPQFLYTTYGSSSVPQWTKSEFVSNILRIFNVLPSYNVTNQTLTLDLFNKIKEKEAIDISDDIEVFRTDFSEFISNYGQNNYFSYNEGSDELLVGYNDSNTIRYGDGVIEVNNDFIEQEADVIESDFTTPITYPSVSFGMSMERINFIELQEQKAYDITSVSAGLSFTRFNVTDAVKYFNVGDLVRIDTIEETYTGDWIIKNVSANSFDVGEIEFDVTSTGTASVLLHKFSSDDNVYLLLNVPSKPLTYFSTITPFKIETTTVTSAAMAYFNLLNNGTEINSRLKQSLSFGRINSPLNYQKTLLDTYWPQFERILNDPVLLNLRCLFKHIKFYELKKFLRPVRIKTEQSNNLYYLNKITGYKNGHQVCESEAIKLS